MKMPDQLERIGKKLRAYRRNLDLTQEQVALKCGLSISMVSAVERGERNVTIETLASLAEALELELVVDVRPPVRDLERAIAQLDEALPFLDPDIRRALKSLVYNAMLMP